MGVWEEMGGSLTCQSPFLTVLLASVGMTRRDLVIACISRVMSSILAFILDTCLWRVASWLLIAAYKVQYILSDQLGLLDNGLS